MKATVGFLQEMLPGGVVANSFMRKLETFFFIILCLYMITSKLSYDAHFQEYIKLLREGCLTEQSFIVLTSQLRMFEWNIFTILVCATVVPKTVSKFAEMQTGVKDNTLNT